MFRSPGRNQRSKGVRAKHVLQICFLLVVCFWLIYQVKHSYDKKKIFDETDAKQTTRPQHTGDVLKLGRKDPISKEEKLGSNNGKSHEETEEDEQTIVDEEENKTEEVAQEEAVDGEDDGGGDGVDEIDEHELEKSDEEVDREEVDREEVTEEEEKGGKENNEKDDEDSGDSAENENALKDQDVEDETTEITHEAREENYKADDASSAVTQTSQTMASDKEVEKSKELAGKNSLGNENFDNNTNNDSNDLKTTASSVEGREIAEIVGDTTTNDAVEKVADKSNDASFLSASDLSVKSHQLIMDTAQINTGSNQSSVQSETETEADRSILKNVTLEDTTSKDVSAQTTDLDQVKSNNEDGSVKDSTLESRDASSSDSAGFLSSKDSISSSGEAEGNMQSSDTKSSINNEDKPSTTDANVLTVNDVTLGSENVDEVHHDPIDSSTNLEEKSEDKDLEILANVLNEDGNNEIAAE